MSEPPAILVAGANGAFGRALVLDLLRRSPCRVLAAGRGASDVSYFRKRLDREQFGRLSPALCDVADARSCAAALTNAQAAVCAAGPYQELPTALLEACLHRGIPYLDLADDRDFARRARALVPADGPPVGVGFSAAPALTALLARLAAGSAQDVPEIRSHIATGARSARGDAAVAALFDSLGKPFEVPSAQGPRRVLGWSEPRVFPFPAPIGPREGLLVDVPDHELFPGLFGASVVEFRAGAEFRWMNRGASLLAWFSRELAFEWSYLAPMFAVWLQVAGFFGSEAGAAGVEAAGKRASLVAPDGALLPILPAAIMAPRLAANPHPLRGLLPLDGWISSEDFANECKARGMALTIEDAA